MVEKLERSHVGDSRSSKRHAHKYGHNNYEYFETIPDELVILIFTKLSSSSDKAVDTVDDIKLLARCSILSKRFYLLVWQVPTLSINCPSVTKLCDFCPKFLKKFKHLTSLQVNHRTNHRAGWRKLPIILWDATYRPHSYCLSVVSYKALSSYHDQQFLDSLMTPKADRANDKLVLSLVYLNYMDMMALHHMLVSSIKDLENLQRVVVTNLDDRGMLILEADVLVQLRNCSLTNLEHVQVRFRYRCYRRYNYRYNTRVGPAGFVARNLCFQIIEWCEKNTTHEKNNVYDDDDKGIPRALTFRGYHGKYHKFFLEKLKPNTDDIIIRHDKAIHTLLSKLKSDGNLL